MNPLPEKCLWFKWSRNRNVGKIELSKCFYSFLDKAIRNVLLRSCIPTWCPLIHDHLLMNTILTVLLYFCLELDQNFVRSHFSDQREGSNLQMLPKNFLKFSLKIIFIFRSVSSKSMWFALCVFTACFHKISTPGNYSWNSGILRCGYLWHENLLFLCRSRCRHEHKSKHSFFKSILKLWFWYRFSRI